MLPESSDIKISTYFPKINFPRILFDTDKVSFQCKIRYCFQVPYGKRYLNYSESGLSGLGVPFKIGMFSVQTPH